MTYSTSNMLSLIIESSGCDAATFPIIHEPVSQKLEQLAAASRFTNARCSQRLGGLLYAHAWLTGIVFVSLRVGTILRRGDSARMWSLTVDVFPEAEKDANVDFKNGMQTDEWVAMSNTKLKNGKGGTWTCLSWREGAGKEECVRNKQWLKLVTSRSPVKGTYCCVKTEKLQAMEHYFCLVTGANGPLLFLSRTHEHTVYFLSRYSWLLVCADTWADWEQSVSATASLKLQARLLYTSTKVLVFWKGRLCHCAIKKKPFLFCFFQLGNLSVIYWYQRTPALTSFSFLNLHLQNRADFLCCAVFP